MVGQALAAVTPKPQTTRMTVRGILNGTDYQVVVEDTPGLMSPRSTLDKAMIRLARLTAASADVVVAVVHPWAAAIEEDVTLIRSIPGGGTVVAAVNKIDLVPKAGLLPLIARYAGTPRVREVVPVSAAQRDGVDRLVGAVVRYLPECPPLYPPDQVSDQSERFFVAEILREQIMLLYHDEVPYATAIAVDEFAEREQGKDFIRAVIWVERESQRMILIGKGGSSLKRLGSRARSAVERMLDRPVYLELWVKVRPKWREHQEDLIHFGFTSGSSSP